MAGRSNQAPDGPAPQPRDMLLAAIAFVLFLSLGRAAAGWLQLGPAPPPSADAIASPPAAPTRTPVVFPTPTVPVETSALVVRGDLSR
jgi:hypothetical protein